MENPNFENKEFKEFLLNDTFLKNIIPPLIAYFDSDEVKNHKGYEVEIDNEVVQRQEGKWKKEAEAGLEEVIKDGLEGLDYANNIASAFKTAGSEHINITSEDSIWTVTLSLMANSLILGVWGNTEETEENNMNISVNYKTGDLTQVAIISSDMGRKDDTPPEVISISNPEDEKFMKKYINLALSFVSLEVPFRE